ncbi:MAG TPA: hypothetical protein VH333_20295, partial [Pseudonocardiaceae bacterium]|nr:hypothetical protein [Pseudonocardiaceae bacterium]
MASHRLKRTMRGALAATAVIAAVGLAPSPATAAPPASPTTGTDPMTQYQQLSQQADALNEQINNAQVDLANKQGLVQKAGGDLATAKAAEAAARAQVAKYQAQVDALTDATFEGA